MRRGRSSAEVKGRGERRGGGGQMARRWLMPLAAGTRRRRPTAKGCIFTRHANMQTKHEVRRRAEACNKNVCSPPGHVPDVRPCSLDVELSTQLAIRRPRHRRISEWIRPFIDAIAGQRWQLTAPLHTHIHAPSITTPPPSAASSRLTPHGSACLTHSSGCKLLPQTLPLVDRPAPKSHPPSR